MRIMQFARVSVLAAAASALLSASSAEQSDNSAAPGTQAASETSAYTPPPPPPNAAERMRLRDGLSAAAGNDWAGLSQLRENSSDPLVRRMLLWRAATANAAPL